MWLRNPLLKINLPWSLGRGPAAAPPKAPGKVPRVTPTGQTSELLRLQSENELLKGKVALQAYQVAEHDAQLVVVRRERQRADELLKERDSYIYIAAGGAQHGYQGGIGLANPGEEAPGRAGPCAWAARDEAHRSGACACAGRECRGGQGLADAVCR